MKSHVAAPHGIKKAIQALPKDALPEILVCVLKRCIDEKVYQVDVSLIVAQLERQLKGKTSASET